MTKMQRVREVLIGLALMVIAVLLVRSPERGYIFVVRALGLTLIVGGASRLVYYVTMAQHMVDGRWMLYAGAFLIDLGIFALYLASVPRLYVMLYLIAGYLFSGVISILRSNETRRVGSPGWKWSMAEGIANVAVAVLCFVLIGSLRTAVYLYSAGLVYAGCLRIATAFRRTAIVYIP